MDYENFFFEQIQALRTEGRYRVFTDIERNAGDFPKARRHHYGATSDVTV